MTEPVTTNATPQPDFLIRLRPVAGDKVAIHDLRRFLKILGRSYRLRCVEAFEVSRDAQAVETVEETE